MSVDEITALPVATLAYGICDLYLWTTNKYLRSAYDVIEAWGFDFGCVLVWCKEARGFNVGGKYQSNVEFCIYAERRKTTERLMALARFLTAAAARAGVTAEDIDREFGFAGRMTGPHWFDEGSSQLAAPADHHWPRLKVLLGVDGEGDELRAAALAERPRRLDVSHSRWHRWPRGDHSAKPEAFLDLVEQVSPGPYLELFARRQRLGWDTWGHHALEHVEMGA
jgi:N6-adenosine-specific RNA methylase IME4